jgi:UDP-glucuronate 4-epimerase
MTTLVTGGAGFIGSHVAERLLARGERVVVLDNLDPYYDPALKRENLERVGGSERLTIIEGDVRDAAAMERAIADHAVRRVAHLAALAGVRSSVEQGALYLEVNALGTVHLLDAARRHGVENFVLGSTSSVYGLTERLPFREDDPADRPLAPYPASKRAAEVSAHAYHHLFGLDVTVLRFFNVYGPAGRPDMMPLRLMRAVTRGEEVPIFDGGSPKRDWTYIDDTVDGVLAALDRPLGYEVINLGVGAPISLAEFIERIEELAGKKLLQVPVELPPSDPPITYCDNGRARRLLDFDPKIDVREGLARTWRWFVATGDGGEGGTT